MQKRKDCTFCLQVPGLEKSKLRVLRAKRVDRRCLAEIKKFKITGIHAFPAKFYFSRNATAPKILHSIAPYICPARTANPAHQRLPHAKVDASRAKLLGKKRSFGSSSWVPAA
jgi:hypothetical protein